MRANFIPALLAAFAMSVATVSCSSEHDHDHDHETEAAEHDEHHHEGQAHGDEIKLEKETADRFGVKVDTIAEGDFAEVVVVSGQIVPASGDLGAVSAPTSGIFTLRPGLTVGSQIAAGATIGSISSKGITGGDQNAIARVEVEAARRELDRLTPLYKEGIVSQKDYNEAEARLKSAERAYSAPAEAGGAVAKVGGVITELAVKTGEYVETGQLIAVVSQNTRMTLRADLPEKYYSFLPHINSANFRPDYLDYSLDLNQLGGRLVSAPTASSAVGGYIPVYFSFDNRQGIMPGAFAEVYLKGDKRAKVLTVPLTALVEIQGNKYVFTKVHDDAYVKHLVTTAGNDGINVEITSGLHSGDVVVTEGARVIMMAETSSVAPVGHTHNH